MNMMTMQFNSSRKVIPQQQQPINIPPTQSSFMGFSAKYRRIQPSTSYQTTGPSTVSPSPSASENVPAKPKSMKWGEPVWLFLHTMAEK